MRWHRTSSSSTTPVSPAPSATAPSRRAGRRTPSSPPTTVPRWRCWSMSDAGAPTWGREITVGVVDGHPCRLYADRAHSVAEFLLTARRWADREFLVQGTRRLSSAEHEEAVARVAALLRDRGIAPGDRVALVGFNSIEWLVAFWAVQAVGGTAVLGNAWWSDDELAAALDQADPALVITDRDQRRPALSMPDVRTV